jgi:hypothetical protein
LEHAKDVEFASRELAKHSSVPSALDDAGGRVSTASIRVPEAAAVEMADDEVEQVIAPWQRRQRQHP